jgi:uncharacterized damage-inducible protein DinB
MSSRGIGSGVTEGARLAELARAVRESTLTRLARVPHGAEFWRPTPGALSFGDVAHHLMRADEWLFAKFSDPGLAGMVASAGEAGEPTRAEFQQLIDRLQHLGEERAARLEAMSDRALAERWVDDRFGGEVTVWWTIVRGNLDHEAHHRGQLAVYLRLFAERTGSSVG